MSIKKEINDDFKEAFKSKDDLKKTVLASLKSEIKNKEIDNKGQELSDEQIISLISSEIKKRRESAKQYKEGGRDDLAQNEEKEAEILQKYLPEQLSDQELDDMIDDAISQTQAKEASDMGKVMSFLKDKIKGRADGAKVASLVKNKLS